MEWGVVCAVLGSMELWGGIPLERSPDPAGNPGSIQEINPLKPTWLLPHSNKSSVIVPDYTRRRYGHNGRLSAAWQTWLELQPVNFNWASCGECVRIPFDSPPPAALQPPAHCTVPVHYQLTSMGLQPTEHASSHPKNIRHAKMQKSFSRASAWFVLSGPL